MTTARRPLNSSFFLDICMQWSWPSVKVIDCFECLLFASASKAYSCVQMLCLSAKQTKLLRTKSFLLFKNVVRQNTVFNHTNYKVVRQNTVFNHTNSKVVRQNTVFNHTNNKVVWQNAVFNHTNYKVVWQNTMFFVYVLQFLTQNAISFVYILLFVR